MTNMLTRTRFDPKNQLRMPAAKATRAARTTGRFNLVNGKPEFMNKDGKAANAGGT